MWFSRSQEALPPDRLIPPNSQNFPKSTFISSAYPRHIPSIKPPQTAYIYKGEAYLYKTPKNLPYRLFFPLHIQCASWDFSDFPVSQNSQDLPSFHDPKLWGLGVCGGGGPGCDLEKVIFYFQILRGPYSHPTPTHYPYIPFWGSERRIWVFLGGTQGLPPHKPKPHNLGSPKFPQIYIYF